MCQSFGNGSLAHSGFAYQYRVVLGASRKYLQHTAYLFVATYHGVQLTTLCQLVQVLGIFAQCIVGILRRLRRYLRALSKVGNSSLQSLFGYSGILKQRGHSVLGLKHSQQQMLYRHKLIAHIGSYLCGLYQHLIGFGTKILIASHHFGQRCDYFIHSLLHKRDIHAHLLKQVRHNVFVHMKDTLQYVYTLYGLVLIRKSYLLRLLYSLLRLDCEIV